MLGEIGYYIALAQNCKTKGVRLMAMSYKVNVLQALKEKGYNTNRLRKERLIAEASIQALREERPISWANIEKLCSLLECQPGDILVYVPNDSEL